MPAIVATRTELKPRAKPRITMSTPISAMRGLGKLMREGVQD